MAPAPLFARLVTAALAPHGRARLPGAAFFGAVALASVWGGSGLKGDSRRPTEYQVKAAYLANFARFVEWPSGALADDQPIPVCIVGQDPFGSVLDAALSGESVDRHPLVARRINAVRDADECRILFISSSELVIDSVIASVERMPILTVSDLPGFLKHGGMIEFVFDANRVRFEINLSAARAAGLNLSSELLRVATAVRSTP
jgi:hypothetical protein